MYLNQTARTVAMFLLCLPIVFSACQKKKECVNPYSYKYYRPVMKTKQEVRDNIRSNSSRAVENPGKIYIFGSYIFLNEVDKGIHIINNSDKRNPQNVGFIDIPGNVDLAVIDNTLYADLYTDLVAIDISNPSNVVLKKTVEGVFPDRFYGAIAATSGDEVKVIAEWVERDTTIYLECESGFEFLNSRTDMVFQSPASFSNTKSESSGANSGSHGMGGSMARFALKNDHLYTVSTGKVDIFDVSTPLNPVHQTELMIDWGIETIFPFKDRMFIGSNAGMYIYKVNGDGSLTADGEFTHAVSCDPVIADDDFAYVTLRSGSLCMGFSNQLDIIRINFFTNPTLVKSYPMTNPHGLGKDGDLLIICDGADGLKFFDASEVANLRLLKHIPNMTTYDVIAYNNTALVVASDGLYQFDYTNPSSPVVLSKIPVN